MRNSREFDNIPLFESEIQHYSPTNVGLFFPSTRSYSLSACLLESSSPRGTSTLPRSLKEENENNGKHFTEKKEDKRLRIKNTSKGLFSVFKFLCSSTETA